MKDLIVCAIMTIILVIMAVYTRRLLQKKSDNELMQLSLNEMVLLYNQIQNEIEATKRFRHDLNKHIRTLEHVMKTRQSQEMQDIYDDMVASYEQLPRFSTHEVINSILSIKAEECQDKHISFAIKIKDGPLDNYKDIDLVALLYNLLDNAIEAAMTSEEKSISLSLELNHGLTIHLDNTSQELTQKTKKNPARHGVGLMIIKDVIKRYQGHSDMTFDNHHVIQTIELNQPLADA